MNYEKFGIGVTFLVLLLILGIVAISTGLAGVEIPSIIPESTPEPNSFYEYCYQMGLDCNTLEG